VTSKDGDDTFILLNLAIVVLRRAAACQSGTREGTSPGRADDAPLRAVYAWAAPRIGYPRVTAPGTGSKAVSTGPASMARADGRGRGHVRSNDRPSRTTARPPHHARSRWLVADDTTSIRRRGDERGFVPDGRSAPHAEENHGDRGGSRG
jgi:hypothetical protein